VSSVFIYDGHGRRVGEIFEKNPKDPRSWQFKFDASGREIAKVYGMNESDPRSYRMSYGDQGRSLECIFANGAKPLVSWKEERDGMGKLVACGCWKDEKMLKQWKASSETLGNMVAQTGVHQYSLQSDKTKQSLVFRLIQKIRSWLMVKDDEQTTVIRLRAEMFVEDTGTVWYATTEDGSIRLCFKYQDNNFQGDFVLSVKSPEDRS